MKTLLAAVGHLVLGVLHGFERLVFCFCVPSSSFRQEVNAPFLGSSPADKIAFLAVNEPVDPVDFKAGFLRAGGQLNCRRWMVVMELIGVEIESSWWSALGAVYDLPKRLNSENQDDKRIEGAVQILRGIELPRVAFFRRQDFAHAWQRKNVDSDSDCPSNILARSTGILLSQSASHTKSIGNLATSIGAGWLLTSSAAWILPMPDSSFVGYVGDADFHDGSIVSVEQHDDTVCVRVRGASGKIFVVDFSGVAEVRAVEPEGMMLYALSEMSCQPPLRRFVFANWDDESKARLEVHATGFAVSSQ